MLQIPLKVLFFILLFGCIFNNRKTIFFAEEPCLQYQYIRSSYAHSSEHNSLFFSNVCAFETYSISDSGLFHIFSWWNSSLQESSVPPKMSSVYIPSTMFERLRCASRDTRLDSFFTTPIIKKYYFPYVLYFSPSVLCVFPS